MTLGNNDKDEVFDGDPKAEILRLTLDLLEVSDPEDAIAVFEQLHPGDQGRLLAEIDLDQRTQLLSLLSPEKLAHILEYLGPEEAAQVLEELEAPELSEILDETRPNVAADILHQLPSEQSQETLEAMEEAEEVATLLQYADDTAGGVMRPAHPVLQQNLLVPNALDVLRLSVPESEAFSSVFVTDKEGRLTGSLSVVRLALARPTSRVQDIMDDQSLWVPPATDQEECARLMERYDINQLPVIDDAGVLIGVIHVDDVIDVLVEEATEDMYKMVGVVGEQVVGPLAGSVRRRLPWLYVNLGTAFLAVLVISLFESTISGMVSLAVFLPIVAAQGGIGSNQTLTLVVRSMALGELSEKRRLRLLLRELILGVIHGIMLGLVIGLIGYLWKRSFTLAIALGLAMIGNMLVAGLAGAGVPLLLRKLRMDPAISSAVIVTTFTDIMGFLLFLGVAAIIIAHF